MKKLIYGKAKTGKTEYLIRELLASKAKRRLWIVPDQFALSSEQTLAERSGVPGLIDIEVLSLSRLAQRLIDEQGGPKGKPITAIGRAVLLREVLSKVQSDLKVFSKSIRKQGFLEELDRTLRALAGKTIEASGEGGLAARKLADLEIIQAAYRERTQNLYLDDEHRMEFATALIPTSQMIRESAIWIDDYDFFSDRELRMIAALSAHCGGLSLALCVAPKSLFSQYTKRTFEQLRAAVSDWTEIELRAPERTGLAALAEHIFLYEDRPTPIPSDQHLELYAADDRYAEIDYVATRIVGLARDAGISLQRIGVICPELSSYEATIRRVFARYDIPYFMDARASLVQNPLTVFLRALFDCYLSPNRPDGMVGLLKSSVLEISRYTASEYEMFCRSRGIVPYNMKANAHRFEEATEDVQRAHCLLLELTARFERDRQYTVREFAQILYTLLADFEVANHLEKAIRARSVRESEQSVERSVVERMEATAQRQIWDRFLDLLEEWIAIDSGEPMSLFELDRLLFAGISRIDGGRIPVTDEAVIVGGIDRVRDRGLDALFVVGALEGAFPSLRSSNRLFTLREKEDMAELGIDEFLDEVDIAREHFRIYFALTRPQSRLYLSYPLTVQDGNTNRSLLIHKIERISHVRPQTALALEQREAFSVSLPLPTLEKALVESKPAALQALPKVIAMLPEDARRLGADWESPIHSMPGAIKDKHLSVSSLEQYGECPFRFFVSRVLNPKRLREYHLEADRFGSAVHEVIEHAMKELYPRATTVGEEGAAGKRAYLRDALAVDLPTLVDRVIEQRLRDEIFSASAENRYTIEKLRQSVHSSIDAIRKQLAKGDFYPVHRELWYDYALPDTEYTLRGIIDRVDESIEPSATSAGDSSSVDGSHTSNASSDSKGYFRVIDYKTGDRRVQISGIYDGNELQLMTYAMAYEHLSDGEIAGIYYFLTGEEIEETTKSFETLPPKSKAMNGISLDVPEVMRRQGIDGSETSVVSIRFKQDGNPHATSSVLTKEGWKRLKERHLENLKDRVGAIDRGAFPVLPTKKSDRSACTFCEYGAICQFDTSLPGMQYREVPSSRESEIRKQLNEGGER
ncbi:MAG: PD-(D/E)XK nuclease family protein [Bacillota bacterium]|nr:PD-(D/E)XK nuclease family protein [Bacillota bacterium]